MGNGNNIKAGNVEGIGMPGVPADPAMVPDGVVVGRLGGDTSATGIGPAGVTAFPGRAVDAEIRDRTTGDRTVGGIGPRDVSAFPAVPPPTPPMHEPSAAAAVAEQNSQIDKIADLMKSKSKR